ncbi:MAG: Veg family protein [Christensenellales bacterium]
MGALELNAIKAAMENRIGETVELHCFSRRKVSKHVGVLEGAYNAVFTVLVVTEDGPRRLSYTYTDVLTKSILIKPAGEFEEEVPKAGSAKSLSIS